MKELHVFREFLNKESLFNFNESPIIDKLKSLKPGETFSTKNSEDLTPLYLRIQNNTAEPSEKSPKELSGMKFNYIYSNNTYTLQKI